MINNIEPLISPLNAVYCFTLVRLKEDFGYALSQCILDTASREYFKISMQKKLSGPFYCFLVLNGTPAYLFLSQEASEQLRGSNSSLKLESNIYKSGYSIQSLQHF
jgi:hypothetical protein